MIVFFRLTILTGIAVGGVALASVIAIGFRLVAAVVE